MSVTRVAGSFLHQCGTVAVVLVPGLPVSSLFGLPVLFYQRTDHFLRCVDQDAESRLHDEVYETCNQREERHDGEKTKEVNGGRKAKGWSRKTL